nr:gamma-type small acid-soluble spore protein [Bacillus cereus group sp. N8]
MIVEVRKVNKKQQGYNKATSGASIQSTNASYGTEFATETNVQAVKQANAQAEAKKAQASGAQSANASYGTEFATETDVHAVKQANAQAEAKKSQSSSSNQ